MLRSGPVRTFSPEDIERFRRLVDGYDANPVPLILLQSERIEWMRKVVAAHELQQPTRMAHQEAAPLFVSDTAELLALSNNIRAQTRAARMRSAALRAEVAYSVAAAQVRLAQAQDRLLRLDQKHMARQA